MQILAMTSATDPAAVQAHTVNILNVFKTTILEMSGAPWATMVRLGYVIDVNGYVFCKDAPSATCA
jgi:hypothetical protein